MKKKNQYNKYISFERCQRKFFKNIFLNVNFICKRKIINLSKKIDRVINLLKS